MEERMKILEMLQSGVITPDEANDLLKTLDNQKVQVESEKGVKTVKMGDLVKDEVGKTLKIKVLSSEGDKVNVNIPLVFLKAAIKSGTVTSFLDKSVKVGGEKDFVKNNIDMDLLISCIENGIVGNIVDIESADGDKVEIFIE